MENIKIEDIPEEFSFVCRQTASLSLTTEASAFLLQAIILSLLTMRFLQSKMRLLKIELVQENTVASTKI